VGVGNGKYRYPKLLNPLECEEIAALLTAEKPAVILEGTGIVCCGESLEDVLSISVATAKACKSHLELQSLVTSNGMAEVAKLYCDFPKLYNQEQRSHYLKKVLSQMIDSFNPHFLLENNQLFNSITDYRQSFSK